MILKNRLNNILYMFDALFALILLVLSGLYLIQNPLWDVQNWYVIAFSNSIIVLLVIQLPMLLKWRFHIEFSKLMTATFYIFVCLTLIVGEAIGVYRIATFYDSFVHFLGGFVLALTGYYIFFSLSKDTNKPLLILFILGFQALFGTIWEIFEYGLDFFIGSNTQSYFDDITQTLFIGQAALKDTMLDFIFNTLGAIVFILILPKIKISWSELPTT
jgi:hypothetical protein